jgi:hypothetical protein
LRLRGIMPSNNQKSSSRARKDVLEDSNK